MAFEIILLWAAVLTLISVLASKISDRFAVPALLLFLVIGMLAGSEGVGGLQFDNYQLAKSIGILALIFIIFLGGIDTTWHSIMPLMAPGILLSTLGVLITALIVGLLSAWLLRCTLAEGLLLGAIVSSTDAAAVFSVLRSKKISLKGSLKPLLEFESGSNDPMAVFLTISMLSILSGVQTTAVNMFFSFALNMGIGAFFGFLMARVTIFVVNKIKLDYEGLYPVLTLSLVLCTYVITTLSQGNGFLAVYILGLFMSKKDFSHKRMLVKFHGGIAWLMQIVMFLALGLLVFPSEIVPVIGNGLLIAGILILFARPLSVFLCLIPFRFRLAEKLMISWVGLRGAVPIILATFPLLAGVGNAHVIFNIVFFVVLTSVLIQGTSIPFVSRLLHVDTPLDAKIKFPIELEHAEGMDASLQDIIVPYNSSAAGKMLAELKIPAQALVVLISRGEEFIVPNGSTRVEEGDVLLVLANTDDFKAVQKTLVKLATASS